MQKLLTPSIYGQESQKRKLAALLTLKVLPVPLNKVVDKRKLGVSIIEIKVLLQRYMYLTLLHSERPELYGVLAILSAVG